jgi:LysR family transcriptional regulator, transcriptional activator for bauABCD operon
MIGRLSDIDFRLLRIFVAVVQSGGFSLASARLNVSESTVSSHMTDLERRLGMRLCERGRAGFRLTDDGEEVYRATTELLEEATRFRDRVTTLRTDLGGTLKLGLPDGMITNSGELVGCLRNYCLRAPQVSLEVLILTPRELERGVLDGSLHLAIAPEHRRVSGLEYVPLFVEQNYLYCGRDHPFFALADDAITHEMLDAASRISRGYLERFDEEFFSSPTHRATVHQIEAAALLILTGQFIGFLPDHFAAAWEVAGKMRAIKRDEIIFRAPFTIITRRDASRSQRVAAFIQEMRRALAAA